MFKQNCLCYTFNMKNFILPSLSEATIKTLTVVNIVRLSSIRNKPFKIIAFDLLISLTKF